MSLENRETVVKEVIDLIIDSVNLKHVDRSKISSETPLMESELHLDSLDVLEIIVALEKKYNVKINNAEEGKKIFRNIGTIADFVLTDAGHA